MCYFYDAKNGKIEGGKNMQFESNSLCRIKGNATRIGVGINDAEIEQTLKGETTRTKIGTNAIGRKTQTIRVV
ncbi:hypothetical protein KKA96_00645 [Patescibacteria group bacterium]|nr:hypothetical protein [Patescibacteria group bacterium]